MVKPGKLGERGGDYITLIFSTPAGQTASNKPITIPTNAPPLAELLQVVHLFAPTAGTFSTTNWTVTQAATVTGGQVKARLVDFKHLKLGKTINRRGLLVVLARTAARGYSGSSPGTGGPSGG